LCGIASEMFLRLWTRAPRMSMDSSKGLLRESGDLPAVYLDYLRNQKKAPEATPPINRAASGVLTHEEG
jgi:hypothetical protein